MRELERMKINKNQEWANYPSVHGQNLIFEKRFIEVILYHLQIVGQIKHVWE